MMEKCVLSNLAFILSELIIESQNQEKKSTLHNVLLTYQPIITANSAHQAQCRDWWFSLKLVDARARTCNVWVLNKAKSGIIITLYVLQKSRGKARTHRRRHHLDFRPTPRPLSQATFIKILVQICYHSLLHLFLQNFTEKPQFSGLKTREKNSSNF